MLHRYAYLWWRQRLVRRFLAGAADARHIQEQVLLRKIRRNAKSDFGREHGFASIRSVADFRRQVPLTTYDDYRPYIDRVMKGEVTAMFSPETRVLMFAMTSGTTSAAKYIPITNHFFAEYRRSWNTWGLATYAAHHRLVRQKTVQLSSDWRQETTPSGVPAGNISGLAATTRPAIARPIFVAPPELIQFHDPAAKHYATLRLTLPYEQVGMMVTANPSTLIEFARRADAQSESLIRDLYDGTLSVETPAAVRTTLARRIGRRHPARARQLERLCEQHGGLRPRDFWPDMSVLAVWTGGSVGVYLPQLAGYYGQTALRDHGLSASEGRMTIPLSDGTTAGLLDYVNLFFEFIPVAEHGSNHPTVLSAHELRPDAEYNIVLTNSAGLYRYDIQDVVRCVGYQGEAPLLEFLNKGAHFSNITGEKLSEFQVVRAVRDSFLAHDLPLTAFTVAPEMRDRPGYVLLLEDGPWYAFRQALESEVERRLAEHNCEYADKRASGRILPLQTRRIPPGTWDAIRRARIADRGNLEEYKHPCLVGDLEFAARVNRATTLPQQTDPTLHP